MRSTLRAALFAGILLALAAAPMRAQAVKLGYINSAQILAQAPGRAEAEAQFDKEVVAYRAQLQRMNDSLNAMATQFDKDSPALDTATRTRRGNAVREREAEYQTRARMLDSTMQTRQAELVRPIMEQVQKVIEAIRTEDNYSMILDVGSQASVVVAADKKLDLTDRVLARLKTMPVPGITGGPVTTPAGVTRPKK
ncbi:MAG: OmpH family outer membrane protein [Gemmatimonadota bacterium]|nr:OmpH family outer membrane protein [Gemmatimonadota bacterium]